jgi:hypothetical protein
MLTIYTKVPEQPREDDGWCGIIRSRVDQREQSRLCARGILASFPLVVFELCREVCPLPPGFYPLVSGTDPLHPSTVQMNEPTNSPHMKRLYGTTLRKDAGLTRVLKTVTRKHAQQLDKHVPELAEAAQDLKKRLESVYGETAVALEDFLARCKCQFVLCVSRILMVW